MDKTIRPDAHSEEQSLVSCSLSHWGCYLFPLKHRGGHGCTGNDQEANTFVIGVRSRRSIKDLVEWNIPAHHEDKRSAGSGRESQPGLRDAW